MDDKKELDQFAKELQEQILKQYRDVYSEAVIERWQNPRNLGALDRPDGYARIQGSCGDTMEMFIKVKDDVLTECTFLTDGCGTTIACGSMATEIARGKKLTQALVWVSGREILKRLGGLPRDNVHCAQLAAETLRMAMADYLRQKKNPWKKQYRKT
ncbi:MAG: iron-sulfur cluster assembly scaffold protein [Candidatus Aminicenantes bacterium]